MSYSAEWIVTPIVIGAVLVVLIVPPFALIALAVLALAALAALVALVGAVLAAPYLLVRSHRRHVAKRRQERIQKGREAHRASVNPSVPAIAGR
jgi:positive regulator of sigma E activity